MTQKQAPLVPVPATDLTASPRQPLGRSFYNPLGHALELQRGLEDALATRVEPTDVGAAIFRDELRRVASLNLLRVEGPRPDVAAADLMAEADRLQAGLPHRAVRVEDESDGIRLAPGFGASGWVPRRSAVMALRRLPDRPVDRSAVSEVEIERLQVAREASLRQVERDLDLAAEAVTAGALPADAFRLHAYAALVGTEVAAYCLLRVGDGAAKLTEVSALARSQGHGVGRAVIWAAAAAARRARCQLVFAECGDEEWEKATYRRLGFDEVGHMHRFVRPWGDEDALPLQV